MALPRLILVREETEHSSRGSSKYLVAGRNVEEAMDETHDPQVIGTYKLVGKRTLRRVVSTKTLKTHRVRG
ncbi:MAG TPA: hypothetical protein VGS01_09585 [Candidatus Limnocylindria bacterium]|jgi:hypothetical protein|nr:hypothetical protein [Candidatus Limnocylindria bacterium]